MSRDEQYDSNKVSFIQYIVQSFDIYSTPSIILCNIVDLAGTPLKGICHTNRDFGGTHRLKIVKRELNHIARSTGRVPVKRVIDEMDGTESVHARFPARNIGVRRNYEYSIK